MEDTYWEGEAPPSYVLGNLANAPSGLLGPMSGIFLLVGLYCVSASQLGALLASKVDGGTETIGGAVQRLTKENMLLKVELAQVKVEMQNMMHIILLYGRMLGCYDGPVPSADALPKLPRISLI